MNIEQVKGIELAKLLEGGTCISDFPEPIGQNVFIRTVMLYYTGQIKKVCGGFVTLEKAAWIADTGRFHDFLKEGVANQVEPFIDDVHVSLGSIIDVTKFTKRLPCEQK